MALTRSDIKASAEDLEQFTTDLQRLSLGALWATEGMAAAPGRTNLEPKPEAVPHVWHWRELRPRALRAAELVGTQQAERRVLQLKNPGIPTRSATTNTLFGGIQIVMPGEVARAHRHTPAALRFIIESDGGYTNVNGEPIPMRPGDLVLTPNWAWHDHANDTSNPMIWLDGLDSPLVRLLETVFYEEFPDETQPLSESRGLSQTKYGGGALRPAWESYPARHSPLMHFPWTEAKEVVQRLAAVAQGSPHDGLIMEYTNPVDGGPVMPTMACFVQMLRPGERTQAHRHTSSVIYHVVEGRGCSMVGGQILEWEEKDVFCVPSWTGHQHVNQSTTEPAFLFSFTDIPVMRSLDLLREEPVQGEWGWGRASFDQRQRLESPMKRSTERILTTHTGSLPRPPDLLTMIAARERGEPVDGPALADRVRTAVDEIVGQQVAAGVDIVSDGEMGKPSFATYITHRLAGFGGENPEPRLTADREEFPVWAAESVSPGASMTRRFCLAPLAYSDHQAVAADIRNLQDAVGATGATEGFMPAASLGIVADIMVNRYYPTEEAYLYALAEAMREEYQAIARAGLVLQIDAPDAALGRHGQFRHNSLEEFRQAVAQRVEALNHALQGIPEEQIRYHICWGNYEGPHNYDVPLRDIVDLVLRVRAGAYSIEASNPRHAHEWRVWEEVKLPAGKVLIPGVIDSTTNFVEHPEVVAERIERYARLVGREQVIAGTDCGFGTSAGRSRVYPDIMWAKFKVLAEGARLASQRLWS